MRTPMVCRLVAVMAACAVRCPGCLVVETCPFPGRGAVAGGALGIVMVRRLAAIVTPGAVGRLSNLVVEMDVDPR